MATFLANEINATDRDVTGPLEQVQIMFPIKDKNISYYYPTLLPRVQISRETSTNNRYLYSPHSSRPREAQTLGKSEFWEKKLLDNKSLIRRFGV